MPRQLLLQLPHESTSACLAAPPWQIAINPRQPSERPMTVQHVTSRLLSFGRCRHCYRRRTTDSTNGIKCRIGRATTQGRSAATIPTGETDGWASTTDSNNAENSGCCGDDLLSSSSSIQEWRVMIVCGWRRRMSKYFDEQTSRSWQRLRKSTAKVNTFRPIATHVSPQLPVLHSSPSAFMRAQQRKPKWISKLLTVMATSPIHHGDHRTMHSIGWALGREWRHKRAIMHPYCVAGFI